jgi:hypothetical protein
MLATSIGLGAMSLPMFLQQRSATAAGATGTGGSVAGGSVAGSSAGRGKAKSCIILYCWGGMSHHETWDMKPEAPIEYRGEFQPIETETPGIQVGEHLPMVSRHTNKLAIVRSIHHDDSAHGRGMYWMLTGHKPPRAGNIPPMREDWPSLPAMISCFRAAPKGVPTAVRLPYPLVDNNTLQAGEYGGWLGVKYDPIVLKTPAGKPYGGVSRSLGSEVLELGDVDFARIAERQALRSRIDRPAGSRGDYQNFQHFHELANDILLGSAVKQAYDLDREDPRVREMYGDHIGGQSMLLARRLTEAGVPVVQVCVAAGDLNGSVGDMWDTHGDNFNRLKNRLLPVFDRGFSALLTDLEQRGTLEDTLIAVLTGSTAQRAVIIIRMSIRSCSRVAAFAAAKSTAAAITWVPSRALRPAVRRTPTPQSSRLWGFRRGPNCGTCSTAPCPRAMANRCRCSNDPSSCGFRPCWRIVSMWTHFLSAECRRIRLGAPDNRIASLRRIGIKPRSRYGLRPFALATIGPLGFWRGKCRGKDS